MILGVGRDSRAKAVTSETASTLNCQAIMTFNCTGCLIFYKLYTQRASMTKCTTRNAKNLQIHFMQKKIDASYLTSFLLCLQLWCFGLCRNPG